MAHPRSRRPQPGRGLPPADRQTPEAAAEDARLRAELELNCIRLDAILVEKRAEAVERARIRAEREAALRETAVAPAAVPVEATGRIRDLWS